MKKVFAFLLAALMVFSLFACGNTTEKQAEEEAAASKLQLGYGRVCITPDKSVPLNGYGTSTNRMSTEVLNDIYVTCLAMSDGNNRALLFSQDLHVSTAVQTPKLRSALTAEVGIPSSNIFFSATANCSAPDLKSSHESITGYYLEFYTAAIIQAAKEALDDLAPATMYSTSTQVEGMSYTHHYTMEDGTVEDHYYGFFDREITGHAAQPDTTMRLVKVERKDKPAVLMINWQCRPTMTGAKNKTVLSADFIGFMRDKVEAETGMKPIYFTGGYGEVSPTTRIESEDHGLDVKAYGEKLADYAIEAMAGELTKMSDGKSIGSYTVGGYGIKLNHADEDKVEAAKKIVEERKEKGYDVADKTAKAQGFKSVYEAGSIVSRAGRKEKEPIEISVLRFGEMGFLMAPLALFSTTGKQTLDAIPTEFGFLLCQSNAAWNTIPSEEAFGYGGYEADVSYFAKGEAERMTRNLNDMLLMTTDD